MVPDFGLGLPLGRLTSDPASDSGGFARVDVEIPLVTWGKFGGWRRLPGWSVPPRLPFAPAAAPSSPAGPASPCGAGGELAAEGDGLGGQMLPLAYCRAVLVHAVPGRGGLDPFALNRVGQLGFVVVVVETSFGWMNFPPEMILLDRLGQLSPIGQRTASGACQSFLSSRSCQSS